MEFPRRYRSCLLAQGSISRLTLCLVRIVLKLRRFRKPTFMTCIRPVTEYACPVFHNALTAYLSAELEQLQIRSAPCELFFCLYHIATHYIKPTWRRSPDAGSLSQLSFSISSLVTQTINCMSSCHLVTIVNLTEDKKGTLMSLWLRGRD